MAWGGEDPWVEGTDCWADALPRTLMQSSPGQLELPVQLNFQPRYREDLMASSPCVNEDAHPRVSNPVLAAVSCRLWETARSMQPISMLQPWPVSTFARGASLERVQSAWTLQMSNCRQPRSAARHGGRAAAADNFSFLANWRQTWRSCSTPPGRRRAYPRCEIPGTWHHVGGLWPVALRETLTPGLVHT